MGHFLQLCWEKLVTKGFVCPIAQVLQQEIVLPKNTLSPKWSKNISQMSLYWCPSVCDQIMSPLMMAKYQIQDISSHFSRLDFSFRQTDISTFLNAHLLTFCFAKTNRNDANYMHWQNIAWLVFESIATFELTIVGVAAKGEKFGEDWIKDIFGDKTWWKSYIEYTHKYILSTKTNIFWVQTHISLEY